MRPLAFALALAALGALASPSSAAEDAIAARQALMTSVGAAAGVGGGMIKGDIDYVPAVGKAVIAAMNAAAQTYGDFFPEGSEDSTRSEALAAIWQDRTGFDAVLARFREAAATAETASGREGPADVDAFRATFEPVLGVCRDCHETYRAKN